MKVFTITAGEPLPSISDDGVEEQDMCQVYEYDGDDYQVFQEFRALSNWRLLGKTLTLSEGPCYVDFYVPFSGTPRRGNKPGELYARSDGSVFTWTRTWVQI